MAQQAMNGRAPIAGPVRVRMVAHFAIPASWSKKRRDAAARAETFPAKRPDASNLAKLAEDAMNGIVYADDAQIVMLTVAKLYDLRPRLQIRVEPVEFDLFTPRQRE
jgi:Holliday junction resolvase RusA-like endonuclease